MAAAYPPFHIGLRGIDQDNKRIPKKFGKRKAVFRQEEKARCMPAANPLFSYFYSVSSQEHRADKTLKSVPVICNSRSYFPSRISQTGNSRAGSNPLPS
jgi:hypothetical protein